MDIFTTQLARIVPVPIKPANLKVKALLKEAETSKVEEDLDRLENHDNYFVKEQDDNEAGDKEREHALKLIDEQIDTIDDTSVEPTSTSESKEEVKHLDLYV